MRTASLCAFIALPAACELSETTNRGYLFDQETANAIAVGDSRESVELLLGSPSATSTAFDQSAYYYLAQQERSFSFFAPQSVGQSVLAIYFDSDDLVREVKRFGLEDGQTFDFAERATPSVGEDLTVMEQMVDRFINPVEP